MNHERVDSSEVRAAGKGHYADVNGIHLYYELHGDGGPAPLILLHGGFGLIDMFGDVLADLAQSRQVIGVDLQAHGRTADVDRPLSFAAMADDIAALIKHLDLRQADVMGYSMGGGVALQTAIRHPQLVRKLVVVSVPAKHNGWFPEVIEGMKQVGPEAAEAMKPSPMYQSYAAVAPRPEDWPVLVTKMGQLIRQDYDWSQEFAQIQAPTLLVFGDADGVRPAHIVEMFGWLGGGKRDAGWDGSGMPRSRLAILPGTSHYNCFQSPLLAAIVPPFLDAPLPA